MERPDWSIIGGMLGELRQAMTGLDETRRRMAAVTATAWSPDRMIRVQVGPRGQLVDLEIDPRALRKPDSKALAATILAAVRSAVEDSADLGRAILDERMPSDPGLGIGARAGSGGLPHHIHDADLIRNGGRSDG